MISQVESFLCPDKQETPEESWRYSGQNIVEKDKDNSPKTLTDKKKSLILYSLGLIVYQCLGYLMPKSSL